MLEVIKMAHQTIDSELDSGSKPEEKEIRDLSDLESAIAIRTSDYRITDSTPGDYMTRGVLLSVVSVGLFCGDAPALKSETEAIAYGIINGILGVAAAVLGTAYFLSSVAARRRIKKIKRRHTDEALRLMEMYMGQAEAESESPGGDTYNLERYLASAKQCLVVVGLPQDTYYPHEREGLIREQLKSI